MSYSPNSFKTASFESLNRSTSSFTNTSYTNNNSNNSNNNSNSNNTNTNTNNNNPIQKMNSKRKKNLEILLNDDLIKTEIDLELKKQKQLNQLNNNNISPNTSYTANFYDNSNANSNSNSNSNPNPNSYSVTNSPIVNSFLQNLSSNPNQLSSSSSNNNNYTNYSPSVTSSPKISANSRVRALQEKIKKDLDLKDTPNPSKFSLPNRSYLSRSNSSNSVKNLAKDFNNSSNLNLSSINSINNINPVNNIYNSPVFSNSSSNLNSPYTTDINNEDLEIPRRSSSRIKKNPPPIIVLPENEDLPKRSSSRSQTSSSSSSSIKSQPQSLSHSQSQSQLQSHSQSQSQSQFQSLSQPQPPHSPLFEVDEIPTTPTSIYSNDNISTNSLNYSVTSSGKKLIKPRFKVTVKKSASVIKSSIRKSKSNLSSPNSLSENSSIPVDNTPTSSEIAAKTLRTLQAKDKEINNRIKKFKSEVDFIDKSLPPYSCSQDFNDQKKLLIAKEKLLKNLEYWEKKKYENGILISRYSRKCIYSGGDDVTSFWAGRND
ncbi:uncharacterized protein ASCRUDRAFT_87458 [Ascoidea rubescens DSM 1968]|uniref:Uncharacterized protein n=1 Tax=Ascoidea rubescens DSM 1968 TaxID=1344418 RepID=A0A1D2VCX4_9ASCO|nr:hypothetical protein ASCRUDRAFT_87458 [Ascoidea rubescens DSM 1968]ODV59370.1 hypothetical protein ASCRUDRAFT_87458 [Ascoidea rubescens DSM 1968]